MSKWLLGKGMVGVLFVLLTGCDNGLVHNKPDQTDGQSSGCDLEPDGGTSDLGSDKQTSQERQQPQDTGSQSNDKQPPAVGCSEGGLCVFPGAEGFGVTTKAGRGGAILRVNTLAASGSGSLQAALETSGPRTIIVDVSGEISLSSPIKIQDPFVTLAGQTAPSPGITLRGRGLIIDTHDVLIRHIRIRIGDEHGGEPDGIDMRADSYNIVIDHVSISWAIDELISTGTIPNHDITISNSIFSEALHNSTHGEGAHSKGFLLGEHSHNIAFIRNLMAHNFDRQLVYNKGDTSTLFVNNLSYDPGRSYAFTLGDSGGNGKMLSSIVGNVSLGLKFEGGNDQPISLRSNISNDSRFYIHDNPGFIIANDASSGNLVDTAPIWTEPLTVMPSADVREWVMQHAGARPADRDAVDLRILEQINNGTGGIIDSQNQVDGWPTLENNQRTLELPQNPSGDDDGDGYTNLEELLQRMADQVEQGY